MIPPEKNEAVRRALEQALGVAEFESISAIAGGHTASLVYRIVVRGSSFLLKIVSRNEDLTRHFESMRAAAEAGLAPRVLYANTADRIIVTDFVKTQPRPLEDAIAAMPAILRTLHALPPFALAPFNTTCTFLLNKGPMLDNFLRKFRSTQKLPGAASEKFFTLYEELAAAYPNDGSGMVSSHNDVFKPDNILYDGQRFWLVDWEAAFLNDRYADLAVMGNQLITNRDEELLYLREYFGAPPDEYQQARFHVMGQLGHLFYTMAFLYTATPKTSIDWNTGVPDFNEYHRRMWAGEIDLSDDDVKITFARTHWNRLLANVSQPRYRDALQLVSGRHRCE
jgi:aminoglycoside phosphotransferase